MDTSRGDAAKDAFEGYRNVEPLGRRRIAAMRTLTFPGHVY